VASLLQVDFAWMAALKPQVPVWPSDLVPAAKLVDNWRGGHIPRPVPMNSRARHFFGPNSRSDPEPFGRRLTADGVGFEPTVAFATNP
jgi:hypothetical protein